MVLSNLTVILIYIIIGIIIFCSGFSLVYANLKKLNRVEGEKFDFGDIASMVGFGLLFALAIVFMLSISFEMTALAKLPNIGGYILLIMLGFIIFYPLWEVILLGKPTSDSVHDFHKFLETKILDKFRGKMAYVVAILIFIVLYIVPILLLLNFTKYDNLLQVSFVWFLIFPLFFLNYFAASGTVSGIISVTYSHTIPSRVYENCELKLSKGRKIVKIIIIALIWIPFLLNLYNLIQPTIMMINGEDLIGTMELNVKFMAYFGLTNITLFGIIGFFDIYWNKKSKTKAIDYFFAGYLIIGISINMLINFFQLNPEVTLKIFDSVSLLAPLGEIFTDNQILLPLIIIQSFITFIYGIMRLIAKKSDFQSDIKLKATCSAYGEIDLDKIIQKRKEIIERQQKKENLDEIKEKEDESIEKTQKTRFGSIRLKLRRFSFLNKEILYIGAEIIDIATLYKSLLEPPLYSKFGVDLNEQLRTKAAQYLFLMSTDGKDSAQKIIDFVFRVYIDSLNAKIDDDNKHYFVSKEAFDLLGEIGKLYPDLLMDRLINAIEIKDIYVQQYILDALGDIGEDKENMLIILEKISPLFKHPQYKVRHSAFQAMTEMMLEGDTSDKIYVSKALKSVYNILADDSQVDIINSCFEALVEMSARIADNMEMDQIIPFIRYNKGKNKELENYIIQNAIIVLSYMVYYNIEKFGTLIEEFKNFIRDERNFIRYAAVDALGNYILKCPQEMIEPIVLDLLDISIRDDDDDVAHMATESIAEFLVLYPKFQISINEQRSSILDFYTNALISSERQIAENASEALKQISPLYDDDIYPLLETHLKSEANLEIVRDCLYVIALSGKEEHESTDLELIYKLAKHHEASVRSEAIFAIGCLIENRSEIDPRRIEANLKDNDPEVRFNTIFTLGKIGKIKPKEAIEILIRHLHDMDRNSIDLVHEVELYAESLGTIGNLYPSNEIIMVLQNVLIGDTHPLAKDTIAQALGFIGRGMIESGKAIRQIENESFYNHISWLHEMTKKEYTIGNLIIYFIQALELKGIPNSVMNEISDSIQDLLPVFLFTDSTEKDNDEILLIIKQMLSQAYYANYNNEILETIDRIDSLLSFKQYFKTDDPELKDQFFFYTKQYTPDGKQFHDQGEIFLTLSKTDKNYLQYALKSFEIAKDLSPFEYFTPNAIFQMGLIHEKLGNAAEAKSLMENALEIFISLDEIEMMKEVESHLNV